MQVTVSTVLAEIFRLTGRNEFGARCSSQGFKPMPESLTVADGCF